MKKAFVSGFLTGIVSVIGGVMYKIHSFHKHPVRITNHIVNHLDKKLRLTAAQRDDVKAIVEKVVEQKKELKEKKREIHRSFSELFLSESFESDSIVATVKEELGAPALDHIGKALEELHGVLAPEQRRELIRLMEKRHGHGCCHH